MGAMDEPSPETLDEQVQTGTRRGPAAVDAAIEEFTVRSRLDEPDAGVNQPGDYDLRWAYGRIDAARRAAEADVITADEALDWLAAEVGREYPDDQLDEEHER